MSQLIELIERG